MIVNNIKGSLSHLPRYFGNEDKYIRISVEDTGIGIRKEDHDKVFKLFGFIRDSEKDNVHGIGLGLAICEKIVNEFDGEISMKSIYEKGSIFTFTFKTQNEK